MKVFSETTFTDLLTDCHNRPRYKGLIVLPTLNEVKNFLDEICEVNSRNPITGVRMIYNQSNCVRLEFDNGSLIEVVAPSESRGKRCHEVLYSQYLPREVINYIGRYEIQYDHSEFFYRPDNMNWWREYIGEWVKAEVKLPDPMDEVVINTELDNFLNEFKIASKSSCNTTVGRI